MKELNVTFQVPGVLTLNGRTVDIPNPKFYIGQKVYVMEQDCHPIDLQPRTIAVQMLLYLTQQDNPTVLLTQPQWGYMLQKYVLQRETLHTEDVRYSESQLMSHPEWLEVLQQAIDEDGVSLEQTIKLFYKYDLKIDKQYIQVMWQNLERVKIDFPYSDLKETARIYLLNCPFRR